MQLLLYGRPQKLLVQQEYQPGVQMLPGETTVNFIQQGDILIGDGGGAALGTFADIVIGIRQPDMQVVHVGIFPGVAYHLPGEGIHGKGIGEAQVGIGGNAHEIIPFPSNFRREEPLFGVHGPVCGIPGAHRPAAQDFSGPAVAHLVQQQVPL